MVIKAKVDTIEIRNLCIHEDWYTRGTNKEYFAMFDIVKGKWYDIYGDIELDADGNDLLNDLYDVAYDIKCHSNTQSSIKEIAQLVYGSCVYTGIF